MAFDFDENQLLAQDRDFFTSAQSELSGPVQRGALALVYVGLRQARESRRHSQRTKELVDGTSALVERTREGTASLEETAREIMQLISRWRGLPWRGIGDL